MTAIDDFTVYNNLLSHLISFIMLSRAVEYRTLWTTLIHRVASSLVTVKVTIL